MSNPNVETEMEYRLIKIRAKMIKELDRVKDVFEEEIKHFRTDFLNSSENDAAAADVVPAVVHNPGAYAASGGGAPLQRLDAPKTYGGTEEEAAGSSYDERRVSGAKHDRPPPRPVRTKIARIA
jgi:hypothetical protein